MKKLKSKSLYEQPLFENIEIMMEAENSELAKDPYTLLRISGTASKGGFVNKNKRMYPTSVLVKAVEKVQGDIQRGKFLGEVDHPEDSGSLSRIAVKFTKLYMQGEDMFFEGEVLATKAGEHLALLLRSGVGVGVSTRGYGSVRPIDGTEGTYYEVQPDYELKGIDCVLDESNVFGKVANFESEEGGKEMELTMEMMQTEYPELYKQIVDEATAKAEEALKEGIEKEFETKVAQAIEEKKAEFMTEAKLEVLESDEIKQLRTIVEAVSAAIKPVMPEAKTKEDLDAELVQTNESLQSKLDTLNGVVAALNEEKAQAEKVLEEQQIAQQVSEKINALVEGHRFEKALRQKLEGCTSVEEAESKFTSESAFITSLVENNAVPTGVGKVKTEGKKEEELNENVARQKRLAGLFEGGTK